MTTTACPVDICMGETVGDRPVVVLQCEVRAPRKKLGMLLWVCDVLLATEVAGLTRDAKLNRVVRRGSVVTIHQQVNKFIIRISTSGFLQRIPQIT